MRPEWNTFNSGVWEREINVRDFIQKNYTPYDGDDSFLAGPTQNTKDLWAQVMDLSEQERKAGGVLDMDTKIISTITSHGPGYLNKEKETIVGFQTDKPFKRSLQPYGGIRMAVKACQDNGYEVDPEIVEFFTKHRKTHNAGVFDAYTPEMRACRSSHIITGLPDAYGRGRIIGDYRRVALYGVDRLIEDKTEQKNTTRTIMYSDVIREREELSEQIRALEELKELGRIYGYDISKPAADVKEAIQWLYFGYLAAVKEQNGAAMSLGRTSTFIDIYAERDLKAGKIYRRADSGICRPLHYEASSGKICPYSRVQRIILRRPNLGYRIHRRRRYRRTSHGYQDVLPLSAHLTESCTAPEPNLTVLWSYQAANAHLSVSVQRPLLSLLPSSMRTTT